MATPRNHPTVDAGLDDTDEGLEDTWDTGHVSGPWDPDELALLLEDDAK